MPKGRRRRKTEDVPLGTPGWVLRRVNDNTRIVVAHDNIVCTVVREYGRWAASTSMFGLDDRLGLGALRALIRALEYLKGDDE